jgi:hypothetical protein
MPGNNVVYTATYTPNVHTITWDANGGTVNNKAVDTTTVAFDSAIDAPQAVKTGYVFAGWTPTVPATMPDNDLAFVATWNAAGDTKYTVETYTMGLDGEYAVASEAKTGVTDSTVTVAPAAKEGFTLNETKSVLEGVVAPNGSTVLKVYYDRNKYNVTVGETTTEYYFGATFKAPAAVGKEGNTFKGWKGTDGKLYAADSDVTVPAIDNFELVAEFEVNEYTVTFKYTENAIKLQYYPIKFCRRILLSSASLFIATFQIITIDVFVPITTINCACYRFCICHPHNAHSFTNRTV